MKPRKSLVARYQRMGPDGLREVTRQFDEEMIIDKSRPLTPAERKTWETARDGPGRARA